MGRLFVKGLTAVVVALVVSSCCWYWVAQRDGNGDGKPGYEGPLPPVSSEMVPFVLTFEDPSYQPGSESYQLPLDLASINRLERVDEVLHLTQGQLGFLLENGMVGLDNASHRSVKFHDVYEWLQEHVLLPTFITSDSMLDAYHLIFQKLLRDLEEQLLRDQLEFLSRRMLDLSLSQVDRLPSEHRHLAEENVIFFAVALRLLDVDAEVPAFAAQDVEEVVGGLVAAEGWLNVPGFHTGEDATQYKPRGHYTASELLSSYFRAMMWYGRITFRGDSDDETRRAVLASVALQGDEDASSAFLRISSVLRFIVGAPDDLTPFEFAEAAEQVMGVTGRSLSPLFDPDQLTALKDVLRELRPPRILSFAALPADEIWGLRILGQASVFDSYIFQQLVYPYVEDRRMPSGLDVMSVLGSDEALSREPLEDHMPAFEANLGELRTEMDGWDNDDWSDNLYNAWLYSLQGLHRDTSGDGYPAFMRTDAWSAKQLNAQLASWTQLTHDTLLYRKQSYTYIYGSSPFTNFTYVEPVPEVYSRLGRMVSSTLEGLRALSLATPDVEARLSEFVAVLGSLERVAVAELTGAVADPDDVWRSRKAYEITEWETPNPEEPMRDATFTDAKTVVVSDVHTDPLLNNCLQEGVGYVRYIVVVVPSEYGPVACVGPVFSHYEFVRPLRDGRLTDEEWTSMLEDGTAPEPAPWAQDFII